MVRIACFAANMKIRLIERNLLQFRRLVELAGESGKTLELTCQIIKELHFLAMQDIDSCASPN